MTTVLVVGGTQVTTSDLHLLFHRAFEGVGCRSVFLSNDSHLPLGEKVLQQARLRFSGAHFAFFNRRVRRAAAEARPDLVFITGSNWYILPETVLHLQRRHGAKVVLNEQHLQVFRPYQAECLALYDHVFTQDSGLTALLAHASPARAVSLLGPACDPAEHRPVVLTDQDRAAYAADLAYVGYAYANRIALMSSLRGLDVRLWGVGWDQAEELKGHFDRRPVHGVRKVKIYNATRINLNLQSVQYQMDGVTCRPFEVLACGAFCLSDQRKDLSRFFRVGEEIVGYVDATDLRRKAEYYLAHPDEARDIADRGRARALAEHTYQHRARQVLSAVGLA